MRTLLTILFLLTFSALRADVSQVIEDMMERYPSAHHRVWYFFDRTKGKEYYRSQFSTPRKTVKDLDVEKITSAYLTAWNNTDFSTATGTQFRGPDSISMTIKGNEIIALDLGRANISLDRSYVRRSSDRWIKPDFKPIESTFALVSKGRRKNTAQVSYTGFKAGLWYVLHRGKGHGMTTGDRTTVYDVTLQDFKKLRQTILYFIGKPTPVTVFDYAWHTMVKSECTPDFYAIRYNPDTKVLYYLHATVEDEICIPDDWHMINRVQ